jgi:FSR family fosmidomycin resistance protein-like MFS transporter
VGGGAAVLAIAHALTDSYAAFLHPLLPRVMEKLGLSITLAATLATTLFLASSLTQPLLGWLADRYGRRPFVIGGVLASGVFLSLIGVAPNFAVLAVLLVLGGIGGAAFHPPGASLAARAADGRGSGARMSVFSFGGSAGYAVGPLVAVGLVSAFGFGGLAFAMAPALLAALVLPALLPAESSARAAAPPPRPAAVLRLLAGPLGAVFGVSAAATFVQRSFQTMMPIVVAQAGGSEAEGALVLTAYLVGQAGGSLTGGMLADRVDRRALLFVLTLGSLPAHLLAISLAPGSPAGLTAAAVAGLVNMAVVPPVVIMAQEMLPGGAAFGSSIAMGLAWATGSVFVLGTGALGDAVGPRAAALVVMPAVLIGTALALHPALRDHRRPVAGFTHDGSAAGPA